MTKIIKTLDNKLSEIIRKKNDEERSNHISSGKLSASMLGSPLQIQILKALGEPAKEIDDYTLRKFKRGNHCESWIVEELGFKDTQRKIEYKGVVGVIDVVLKGNIPLEIKSVANSKFKRLNGSPDRNHCLQACLYALALESDKFLITYIASDDYRTLTYEVDTKDWSKEVESIIKLYDETIKLKVVPKFEAVEVWWKNPKYYPFDIRWLDDKYWDKNKDKYKN